MRLYADDDLFISVLTLNVKFRRGKYDVVFKNWYSFHTLQVKRLETTSTGKT